MAARWSVDSWSADVPVRSRANSRPSSAGAVRSSVVPPALPAAGGSRSRRPSSAGRGVAAPTPFDEEIQHPPLSPIVAEVATPLERQFATALGIEGSSQWVRLPSEVEACRHGGRCCWRWLARGVTDQIAGPTGSTNHMVLGEAVQKLRSELRAHRSHDQERKEALARAAADGEELSALKEKYAAAVVKLQEFRHVSSELGHAQQENDDLRAANARLTSNERGLDKLVSSLQAQQRVLVEGDLVVLRRRAEEAERSLKDSERAKDELSRRLSRVEGELHANRANDERIRMLADAKAKAAKAKSKSKRPAGSRGRTSSAPARGSAYPGRR